MLKILPFDLLITQTKGLLVHSILNKYSPIALHYTWQTNQERDPNYGLWDAHLLYIPFARTDHVKRLPFFSLPKLWNDLPDFKLSRNHITFKIARNTFTNCPVLIPGPHSLSYCPDCIFTLLFSVCTM